MCLSIVSCISVHSTAPLSLELANLLEGVASEDNLLATLCLQVRGLGSYSNVGGFLLVGVLRNGKQRQTYYASRKHKSVHLKFLGAKSCIFKTSFLLFFYTVLFLNGISPPLCLSLCQYYWQIDGLSESMTHTYKRTNTHIRTQTPTHAHTQS